MREDISARLMEKYFEAKRLGYLTSKIPVSGFPGIEEEISLDLTQLFRNSTGLEFFEYQMPPENIEAICVYGDVLYKNSAIKKKTKKQKRIPEEFDVMVIAKNGCGVLELGDKFISPKTHSICSGSEGKRDIVDFSAVKTKSYVLSPSGYSESIGGATVHITYRSARASLEDFVKGDKLIRDIFKYGTPIVGVERFKEIARNIKIPKREDKPCVEWYEDTEGILQGAIL